MKKITVTTVASLLTALPLAGAMAAAPATSSWSGFYGGLSVGYQDALVRGDGFTLNYFGITDSPNPKGVTGGGFAGFNFPMPGANYLLGVEASVDAGGHDDSNTPGPGGVFTTAKVTGSAALKARVGYTGKAGFMPWLSAGVIAARTDYKVDSLGGPFAGNDGTQTAFGLTGGVGVDYSLGGPLFARVSYSYSHVGAKEFFRDQPEESFDLHDFKIGLGYGF